jgi:hypothetical protein
MASYIVLHHTVQAPSIIFQYNTMKTARKQGNNFKGSTTLEFELTLATVPNSIKITAVIYGHGRIRHNEHGYVVNIFGTAVKYVSNFFIT